MERKDFIKATFAACGLVLIPTVIIESCTKSANTAAPSNVNFTLDLNNSANVVLKTVGGSLITNNILVICTGVDAYVALSSICTHQGCTVGYNSSAAKIICPCHGGTYDITGKVVSGPPPSALVKYNVTQSGSILTIKSA